MTNALAQREWDVVIADHTMPHFSAFEALKCLQSHGLDRPFIIVSGTISEEAAVEAMRAGAHDYIAKGKLSRLLPAIERELREVVVRQERKRAQEALRQSEERYRKLLETSPDAITLTDLTGAIVFANQRAAVMHGYESVGAIVGKGAMELVAPEDQHRAAGNPDIALSVGSVRDVECLLLRKDGTRFPAESSSSVITDSDGRPVGIVSVTKDITQRKRTELELHESLERLHRTMLGTIQAMAKVVEARDPYTAGHQQRVAKLARAVATALELAPADIEGIDIAATVHDIGKIAVPAEILVKPSRLTELELAMIKLHSQAGYDILKPVEYPWPVAEILLQHHERLDGSGYPRGLVDDAICVEARVIAVADTVEAMASHRPYRPALGVERALEEIANHRGLLYDCDVVDACIRLFAEKGFTFG